MKTTVKLLEEIGQNSSLNQFDSIKEMLCEIEEYDELVNLLKFDNDLVCGVFQEDEDEDDKEDEKKAQ